MLIQKALKGLSYLFIAKICSKILDFVLNVLIIGKISQEILGLTMHYNLLFSFSLFYVKLCLKMAYLKRTVKVEAGETMSQEELDEIIYKSSKNMVKEMTFGVYITTIWTLILYLFWDYYYGYLDPNFSKGAAMFCISASIASIHDVLMVRAFLNFEYGLAAKVEGISLSMKNILLFLTIYYEVFPPLLCFGVSTIAYACALVLSTYVLNRKYSIGSFFSALTLDPIETKSKKEVFYVHKGENILCQINLSDMKAVGSQMTIISVIKFLMQELEKIILINIGTNLRTNAEYTVVSNLGALIPRHIYAPVEEVCYNLFAKMDHEKKKNKFSDNEINIIQNSFRMIHILGLFLVIFGYLYSPLILSFLYGEKYNTTTCIQAMRVFWVYVYVMGINGLSEALFFSTAGPKHLKTYQFFIGIATFLYIGLCYLMSDLDSLGIIIPNIIAMLLRIVYCFSYLKTEIQEIDKFKSIALSAFPSKILFISMGFTFICINTALKTFPQTLIRFGIGGVFGVANLLLVYKFHKRDILKIFKKSTD